MLKLRTRARSESRSAPCWSRPAAVSRSGPSARAVPSSRSCCRLASSRTMAAYARKLLAVGVSSISWTAYSRTALSGFPIRWRTVTGSTFFPGQEEVPEGGEHIPPGALVEVLRLEGGHHLPGDLGADEHRPQDAVLGHVPVRHQSHPYRGGSVSSGDRSGPPFQRSSSSQRRFRSQVAGWGI